VFTQNRFSYPTYCWAGGNILERLSPSTRSIAHTAQSVAASFKTVIFEDITFMCAEFRGKSAQRQTRELVSQNGPAYMVYDVEFGACCVQAYVCLFYFS